MPIPHYTYLVLKMPGHNGIIMVKGSFELSDICDKEFHKMAQTFGTIAEYGEPKGKIGRRWHRLQGNLRKTKPSTLIQKRRNFGSTLRTRTNL
jgi:hypothetical protein